MRRHEGRRTEEGGSVGNAKRQETGDRKEQNILFFYCFVTSVACHSPC